MSGCKICRQIEKVSLGEGPMIESSIVNITSTCPAGSKTGGVTITLNADHARDIVTYPGITNNRSFNSNSTLCNGQIQDFLIDNISDSASTMLFEFNTRTFATKSYIPTPNCKQE